MNLRSVVAPPHPCVVHCHQHSFFTTKTPRRQFLDCCALRSRRPFVVAVSFNAAPVLSVAFRFVTCGAQCTMTSAAARQESVKVDTIASSSGQRRYLRRCPRHPGYRTGGPPKRTRIARSATQLEPRIRPPRDAARHGVAAQKCLLLSLPTFVLPTTLGRLNGDGRSHSAQWTCAHASIDPRIHAQEVKPVYTR